MDIILPSNDCLKYSAFAERITSTMSISEGQKSEHLPHFRQVSKYLLMFLFIFKSPFITPLSIINCPRDTAHSLPVV